ncbi:MAG TPA: PadR family transcriptional regulator [Dehalococcoidia bacterium]|nr:PadR family transcriptional regulator [Dehalococcoidia bacterium]
MPRTKAPPTAAEYAVLGVLRETPAHGYRVAQRFSPRQDLGLLYPLEQSAVYALLHDLQARALITGEVEAAGPRPPRTLFRITAAGESYLRAWLAVPVEPIRRLRLDFLLKLHFATRDDPTSARHLITAQLTIGAEYLAGLDTELDRLDTNSLERLIVESKRAAVESFVTWLRVKRELLEPVLEGERH